MLTNKKKIDRDKRHKRIRQKIVGTEERPRLSVFRSSKNIYAQLVNDREGKTLTYANSLEKDIR
ncbi:50S ribosomal protein L18, partial [bacterium]|nr:50S ribosomal protein L18 [bacterium]